jgi:hypothetical protein
MKSRGKLILPIIVVPMISLCRIDNGAERQKKIIARMNGFGMEPLLAAYYGMISNPATDKFPSCRIIKNMNMNLKMTCATGPLMIRVSRLTVSGMLSDGYQMMQKIVVCPVSYE